MIEIIKENFSGILGITGTLLGVILGALLESYSRRGKIKLFQKSLSYSFQELNSVSGYTSTNDIITSFTDHLNINISLEIFNTSSHSKKILREAVFEVRFKSKYHDYKLFNPPQKTESRWVSRNFESLSVSPKDILDYNLNVTMREQFEEIINSKWFIRYRDEKNNIHRFELDKSKFE